MGYEFKPPSAGRSIDAKKIAVGVVAVLLVLVLFSVGKIFTGYATYTGDLEKELNTTKEDLKVVTAARTECAQDLTSKNTLYSECSSNLGTAKSSLATCQQDYASLKTSSEASLNACKADLDSSKANNTALAASYRNLVKNSVKSICCTVSDADAAATKNWRLENDKILCSGNFTVNCATGETGGF